MLSVSTVVTLIIFSAPLLHAFTLCDKLKFFKASDAVVAQPTVPSTLDIRFAFWDPNVVYKK